MSLVDSPVAGVMLVGLTFVKPEKSPATTPAPSQAAELPAALPLAPAAADVDPLEGAFSGEVKMDWGLAGELTGVLATPTATPPTTATPSAASMRPDLGAFDLGLLIRQSGSSVTAYVDLSDTLVFTRELTIQATPVGPTPFPGTPAPGATPLGVGPQLTGSFDGTNLQLLSARLKTTIDGKDVERQFSMKGIVERFPDHISYSGEYRETVWKYMPQPVTIVGTFLLFQPLFIEKPAGTATVPPTPGPSGTPTSTRTPPPAGWRYLYLPIIRR